MNKILEKIKKGKIEMKSKKYFIIKTILYTLGIVFVFFICIFIIGFIVFFLRTSGMMYFPRFGFRGFGILLVSFPWILAFLSIVLIILLELFAKKLSIVYKKPLIYSIVGIIILVLLFGIVFSRAPVHRGLFDKKFIRPNNNAYIGRVIEITNNGFKIQTKKKEDILIIPSVEYSVKNDEWLMIMGKRHNSTINAFDIRRFVK